MLAACGGGGSASEAQTLPTLTVTAPGMAPAASPAATPQTVATAQGRWVIHPDAPWAWRDGAGLLAKDGGLYLLGGWNGDLGGTNSEVWFTRDLVTWQFLGDAPWPARHGAGWVVHQDRLYVIGGDLIDDVWSSQDGITWTQHASITPMGPRYTPNAASINGELFVFNGQDAAHAGLPVAYSSSDGGATWTAAGTLPYASRALIHGTATYRGRTYVIGGGHKGLTADPRWPYDTTAERGDIWSTADGRDWRMETSAFSFAPRTHFSVLGTSCGCYVANGSIGRQEATTGEIYFAPDCLQFRPLESPMPRVHATSMVEFNGSIVILGGHGSAVGSKVFQYFPE